MGSLKELCIAALFIMAQTRNQSNVHEEKKGNANCAVFIQGNTI